MTVRTLLKALHDAGKSDLIPRDSAQDHFSEYLSEDAEPSDIKPKRRGVIDEWVYVIDAEMFVRRAM